MMSNDARSADKPERPDEQRIIVEVFDGRGSLGGIEPVLYAIVGFDESNSIELKTGERRGKRRGKGCQPSRQMCSEVDGLV